MTRQDEKLVMAEELGLNGYVDGIKKKIADAKAKEEREAVVAELTSMKFKPITMKKIGGYFPKWKFIRENNQIMALPGLFIGVFASMFICIPRQLGPFPYMLYGIAIGSFIGFVIGHFGIRKVEIASMPLSQWTDDLPYGALLAVKEAKEFGVIGFGTGRYNEYRKVRYAEGQLIYSNSYGVNLQRDEEGYFQNVAVSDSETKDFRIYYPRLENRPRLAGDPVITGLYKGIEVEIFAWDDKKIRPENY